MATKTKTVAKTGKGRARTELSKAQEAKVVKMFTGTKKVKGIKDAYKISRETGMVRHSVMRTLERLGLRKYAPGSYGVKTT